MALSKIYLVSILHSGLYGLKWTKELWHWSSRMTCQTSGVEASGILASRPSQVWPVLICLAADDADWADALALHARGRYPDPKVVSLGGSS